MVCVSFSFCFGFVSFRFGASVIVFCLLDFRFDKSLSFMFGFVSFWFRFRFCFVFENIGLEISATLEANVHQLTVGPRSTYVTDRHLRLLTTTFSIENPKKFSRPPCPGGLQSCGFSEQTSKKLSTCVGVEGPHSWLPRESRQQPCQAKRQQDKKTQEPERGGGAAGDGGTKAQGGSSFVGSVLIRHLACLRAAT